MAQGVNLAIKLTFDGKEVTGGVSISRDDFRKLAVDAKRAGEAMSGGMTSAAQGVRSVSGQLDVLKNAMLGYVGVTQLASSARWIVDQTSAMTQLDARLFQSSPAIAGGRDSSLISTSYLTIFRVGCAIHGANWLRQRKIITEAFRISLFFIGLPFARNFRR